MYKFKGKLINKGELQVIGEKQFKKMEFVVLDDSTMYPNYAKFEIFSVNTELLNNISIDDNVEVTFKVKGREYNGKFYTSLEAFKVYKQDSNNNSDKEDFPF